MFSLFKENPLLFLSVLGVSIGLLALAIVLFIKSLRIKRASAPYPTWIPVGLVVGILGFVGGMIFLAVWSSNRQISIETAETRAEIILIEYVSSGSRSMDKYYRFTYRFTVNGQIYEASIKPRADSKYATTLREQAEFKACYNPANPNESHIWRSEFQCGGKPGW